MEVRIQLKYIQQKRACFIDLLTSLLKTLESNRMPKCQETSIFDLFFDFLDAWEFYLLSKSNSDKAEDSATRT